MQKKYISIDLGLNLLFFITPKHLQVLSPELLVKTYVNQQVPTMDHENDR